ncbi:MAG: hypothetical protein IMZ55_06430, partial [Acidobacteria bacterium]|nr:hypothetical protein [Acidobacteriota bacterium]
LTLRQLAKMAEGRDRQDWRHTAEILAMMLNVNRAPGETRWITGAEIDPYKRRDDD